MGSTDNRKGRKPSQPSESRLISTSQKRSGQENLYIRRINAVIDHARENLKEDLSLDVLAQVAGFSPFHFHRVFKSITGETLSDMVVRLRLERAAVLLRSSPELSITDAAFECGFRSVSVFSRLFKRHYGLNARQWDRQHPLKNSKNGQVLKGFTRPAAMQARTAGTSTQP